MRQLDVRTDGPADVDRARPRAPRGPSVVDGDAADSVPARGREERDASSSSSRCERWGVVSARRRSAARARRSGCSRWEGSVGAALPLRIYPRRDAAAALVRAARHASSAAGDLVAARADGLEFADIRPFAAGDRVRSVNWRASARRGELIVNESHPERTSDVILFLDSFAEARGDGGRRDARPGRPGGCDARRRVPRAPQPRRARQLRRHPPVARPAGPRQRYRIIDALIETGVEFSYAWKDVNVIPARTLPPQALVIALTPLLDQRTITALLDLRARGFDLGVVDVSPVRSRRAGRRPRQPSPIGCGACGGRSCGRASSAPASPWRAGARSCRSMPGSRG